MNGSLPGTEIIERVAAVTIVTIIISFIFFTNW